MNAYYAQSSRFVMNVNECKRSYKERARRSRVSRSVRAREAFFIISVDRPNRIMKSSLKHATIVFRRPTRGGIIY